MGDLGDLRERAPAHSLIEQLLHQWDVGAIRVEGNDVVMDDDARGWYSGVLGERRVADVLGNLGWEWTVLHSVPVGSGESDIDHVVIGPGGVFTINTKHSPGKTVWAKGRGMYVGGQQTHYISNSLAEARRAQSKLSAACRENIPVTPLLVFVDPGNFSFQEPQPEVRIVSSQHLLPALLGRRVIDQATVQRIVDAAVQPATWHTSPTAWRPAAHMVQEFDALQRAVGSRTHVTRQPAARTRAAAQARRPASRKRKQPDLKSRIAQLVGFAAFLVLAWAMWPTLTALIAR